MKEEIIRIDTEYLKLDSFLKLSGVFPTGGQAKEAVQSGQVLVNGEVCISRGRKLRPGDRVSVSDALFTVGGPDTGI